MIFFFLDLSQWQFLIILRAPDYILILFLNFEFLIIYIFVPLSF